MSDSFDGLALSIQVALACLTLGGIAYSLLALRAARLFARSRSASASTSTPSVSVLKPIKGVDGDAAERMYAGLASHCRQSFPAGYEILFGVTSLDDPAVALIERLRQEFPSTTIRLVECPKVLGPNGKVSNLAQMVPHATHELLVVNDSDIAVSPLYLERIAAPFAATQVGLITAPYRGHSMGGVWSKIESLGIAADFMPGVLTAQMLENGIHFGLGSTLATTKSALASIGGFAALVSVLADDYELGARLAARGYRVVLSHEVVETTVPRYTLRGLVEHQLRWARGTRDSRRSGYIGLGITYVVPWALLTMLSSGAALWSWSLLSAAALVRLAVALSVGTGLLRDEQVFRDIWLLPLRDCFGLFFWVWSYASDTVVWRGERFRLHHGNITRL